MSYSKYLKMAGCEREFAKPIVMDIAAHTDDCKQYARINKQDVERAELSWFEDLDHGGCRSGLVGMFVYHSDCRAFYQKHAAEWRSGYAKWKTRPANLSMPTVNCRDTRGCAGFATNG